MQNNPSFTEFLDREVEQLSRRGKFRLAETYRSALHALQRFAGRPDIRFEDLTPPNIALFESHLAARGISRNTSSFYMRNLRAVYNQAVLRGITPDRQPFRRVYTGVDRTRKRAVPLQEIQRLKALNLSGEYELALARDLFLLSYYCRGMAFVDIAYLRPENISDGRLTYCRRKTGQPISLRWEKCMQEIAQRYRRPGSPYLLPLILGEGPSPKAERSQYKNAIYRINRALRILSQRLQLERPLTTYVARHSWASAAYQHDIPVSLISEALGHHSERTTRIYLSSLDNERIDRANRLLISFLE